MCRTLVIGDVHGCRQELESLLDHIELKHGDQLQFVGDLVDRGPDSIGVIRLVRDLVEFYPGSSVIAGNHEEKALRYREKGEYISEWSEKATVEDWDFIDHLPLIKHLPEHNAVLVHGGFFPRFFEVYGELGDIPRDWRHARGKRMERIRRFLRIRRVDNQGNMVSLAQGGPEDPHWSSVYDGREGFCFFGHDPQIDPPEVLRGPHALGIDTGCCFGGRLTAAVLQRGAKGHDYDLRSVPAQATYAASRDAWRED